MPSRFSFRFTSLLVVFARVDVEGVLEGSSWEKATDPTIKGTKCRKAAFCCIGPCLLAPLSMPGPACPGRKLAQSMQHRGKGHGPGGEEHRAPPGLFSTCWESVLSRLSHTPPQPLASISTLFVARKSSPHAGLPLSPYCMAEHGNRNTTRWEL